jgi:hypothetical protein
MVTRTMGGSPIDPVRRRVLGGLALGSAGIAPPARAQHTQAEAGHVQGAGQARAARPPLAISAAFAPGGDLWVVGLNAERRLTIRVSRDGRTFGAARVLDTGHDAIAAEGEARPKIAFGPRGWVVITYTQPLALSYSGDIRMLRSTDGGRSFGPPFTVHQDRQVITHRFDSVAFDATGALHTLWIDKRDAEAARKAAPSPAAAKTAYAGAAVYRNVSHDGGATFAPDQRLADHSCECCRIALARDPEGGLAVLWRHVFDGNVRDHAFARIAPRGEQSTALERATFDGWVIDACPHHGPALARAADGGYHAVWFGEHDGEAAARYGRLAADGAPAGEARPLPDTGAEHATVASTRGNLAIAWRSFDGEATRVRALVSTDDGQTFFAREVAASADDSDYPLLVASERGVVMVWRTMKEIHVERLV